MGDQLSKITEQVESLNNFPIIYEDSTEGHKPVIIQCNEFAVRTP